MEIYLNGLWGLSVVICMVIWIEFGVKYEQMENIGCFLLEDGIYKVNLLGKRIRLARDLDKIK